MIFKNPIIFLIKHYKKIHLVLSIFLILLIVQTTSLLSLFNSYVDSGWYINNIDLINEYMSINYFATIIIVTFILVLLIFIFIQGKGKLGYYISGIFIMAYIIVITNIQYDILLIIGKTVVSASDIRLNRDLIFIALIFEYSLMFISVFKTLGFNVKKIEFEDSKDVDFSGEKELELKVSFDSEGVHDQLNNKLFYIKSWMKEHFMIVIIIVGVIVFGLTYSFYGVLLTLFDKVEYFSYNEVDIFINKTYKTNYDSYYNYLNEDGYYYLVVEVNLKTESSNKYLTNSDFLLCFGENEYNPISNVSMYDIGTVYNRDVLSVDSDNIYILVFEVNENISLAEFKMVNSEDGISLSAINLDINNDEYYFELGDENLFIDAIFETNKIRIYGSNFNDYFTTKKDVCISDFCTNMTIKNSADILNDYTLFYLGIDTDIDINILYLLNNKAYIRANNYYGEEYSYFKLNLNYNLIENNYGNVYYEVKNDVLDNNNIELVLVTRQQTYVWRLK